MCNLCNTVKIGTEFTFRKDNYLFGIKDLERGKDRCMSQIIEAGAEINRWTTEIAKAKGKKYNRATVYDIQVSDGIKKHESLHYNAKKVKFIFHDNRQPKNQCVEWCVNFDLDPMCIELQADPVTYQFYETYEEVIQDLIFGKTTCIPEPRCDVGGGGHISLDLATAFENNPQYLRNFLVLYEAMSNDEENEGSILRRSQDIVNAPYMYEIGERGAFIDVIGEFNRLPSAEATMDWLVGEINKRVYTERHEGLPLAEAPEGDEPHYQAVNLEHVLSNTPLEQRRVEMRRFDAQQNVRELLTELDALYDLLYLSREPVKMNLGVDGRVVRE